MLKKRSEEIEIMDDLDISGPIVDQTLKELNTINHRLGGNAISLSAFQKLMKGRAEGRVADLGCGGGDIMQQMAVWCRKVGKKVHFTGVDANPHIVDYARKNTAAFSEISYEHQNVFSEKFAEQTFDIIHCCLFLHHFSEAQLVSLFKLFKQNTRVGVIINDLHRHPLAYWSIWLLTRLFSRSAMVRNDAAVSVARGFKRREIAGMMKEAGITQYTIQWRWAFRWKIIF